MIKTFHTFDSWPEKYDLWFETPIGKLICRVEGELIRSMFHLEPGGLILDAGCGTGIFTRDLFKDNVAVAGLELSLPMLRKTVDKLRANHFYAVQGDMKRLPFASCRFDGAISVTAIEFIEDAEQAVAELFRVTKPGGYVLAATLNSLSPWAKRREAAGKAGHAIFKSVFFRSPDDMRMLSKAEPVIKTAVHFGKHEDPVSAAEIEAQGRARNSETGAFLVACWKKPF